MFVVGITWVAREMYIHVFLKLMSSIIKNFIVISNRKIFLQILALTRKYLTLRDLNQKLKDSNCLQTLAIVCKLKFYDKHIADGTTVVFKCKVATVITSCVV